MRNDFLAQFLGSQTLARVLRTFVLNAKDIFSVSELAWRSGIREDIARREVSELVKIGLVKKTKRKKLVVRKARKKVGKTSRPTKVTWEVVWTVNPRHEHLPAVSEFVHRVSPAQYAGIVKTLSGSGKLTTIILSGAFLDDPSRPADLVVAGEAVNTRRLEKAVQSLEPMIGREIRYATFSTPELRYRMTVQDRLVRDTLDYPHLVLLDKQGMLL